MSTATLILTNLIGDTCSSQICFEGQDFSHISYGINKIIQESCHEAYAWYGNESEEITAEKGNNCVVFFIILFSLIYLFLKHEHYQHEKRYPYIPPNQRVRYYRKPDYRETRHKTNTFIPIFKNIAIAVWICLCALYISLKLFAKLLKLIFVMLRRMFSRLSV